MARVALENVRVDFPIYGAHQRSIRSTIFRHAAGGLIHREGRNNERIVVRALDGISLYLEEGDRLGIIGHNGSGKSTLLKVIAGIYDPTSGMRAVEGSVTPLFDMLPGLDPEDSGYENILTSGMLLGMSRDQIENKIPEIEEFSELGEYLSLPVRTYSAGMTLRLGFAVVTALEPGVLLMDEGLGFGDLRFAERAEKRMGEFIGRSRIIVLASHSDNLIKSLCNKAALLQEGRLVSFGSVETVLERYEALAAKDTPAIVASAPKPAAPPRPVYSEESIRDVGLADRLTRHSGAVRFTKAVARDPGGKSRWTYAPGETVTFRFEYEVYKQVSNLAFYFRLYLPADNPVGQHIIADLTELLSSNPLKTGEIGAVELALPDIRLMPNRFLLYVGLAPVEVAPAYDVIDTNVDLPALSITTEKKDRGLSGAVSLDYKLRKIEMEELTPAAVAES